jgi:hypothetical protein
MCPFLHAHFFSFLIQSLFFRTEKTNEYMEIKSKDRRNEETEIDNSPLWYIFPSLKTHTKLKFKSGHVRHVILPYASL